MYKKCIYEETNFLCKCEKCNWVGCSRHVDPGRDYVYDDWDIYCPECGAYSSEEDYDCSECEKLSSYEEDPDYGEKEKSK